MIEINSADNHQYYQMREIILGLGDYAVSRTPGDHLKTFALGSCVAVVMYDPFIKAAGMIHVVLPEASLAPEKVPEKPGYFADTGLRALMKEMRQLGSFGRILTKLVGGAQIADANFTFNIGKRNILAVKKNLWALHMGVLAEDLGGTFSRTVKIETDTGQVLVSNPSKGTWEL